MHPILADLCRGFTFTGALRRDVPAFLRHHDCPNTADHVADVAAESRRVAELCGADPEAAEDAGWLHDVSGVFPGPDRARIARELGVEVLTEEERYPPIIHQKLSVVLALELFGVTNEDVLSAVGCHTTLKANPSTLDKVLFVADKIAWDQPGSAPFHADLHAALARSLDDAALCYLRYMWDLRAKLKVLHPWLREAYVFMCAERIVAERFPDCRVAIVGGSVVRGQGTDTSDLDVVVLTEGEGVPYRESFTAEGWPVEAFVHNDESLLRFFGSDAKSRTPSLQRMCAEGFVLRDWDGSAERIRAEARAQLERGPQALSPAELRQMRYALTDLLDDLRGGGRPEEQAFVAYELAIASANLLLAAHGQWTGRGKWVDRALRRFRPALADELAAALAAFHREGARDPLLRFAEAALAPVGGPLFDGFTTRE